MTTQKLKDNCIHLYYEILMLNETAKLSDVNDGVKNNSYLESFTVHSRILIDFLFKPNRGREKNDIFAVDYFDESTDWDIGEIPEILKKAKKRVGKEIVHLTTSRVEVILDEKGWNRVEICKQINEKFTVFINSAPDKKISPALISLRNKMNLFSHP
ncbi:hypothetical protein HQ544_04850 [Candidatus Falkowbacteria bacterium]|nr:hypothetical protein [Candidatus Falkowbacteria bacterium]